MKGSYFLLAFFVGILHAAGLKGQFYSTGEAPASLRWSRINTRHFTLVFPEEISEEAVKLAGKLEQFKTLTEEDLNASVKRFPIVLHSTSVLSNGYVTLAPKRMELVSVPPQDAYAQDWITQLALHEYRHVAQLSKMNQGFTRVLSWVTGEIAPGGISSLMPSWFYEGDAVYNETRLSATGRGRIPGFEMPLRTLLLNTPVPYSYDKAVFGSYRDFVPDRYRFGYQVVNFARTRYGPEMWQRAMDYTARNPFSLWPLAFYLKKNYGFYKSGLYYKTMDSLKVQYNNQKDTINYIKSVSEHGDHRNNYTHYILPKDLGKGNTLALRNGLDDPGSFVISDSAGNIKRLFRTGYTLDLDYDLRGDLIVWDEIHSDMRWERRDYSILRTYSLETRKQKTLTFRTRYFSPDISPGGQLIAVAETDRKGRNTVTLIDASTGEVMEKLPAPQNKMIQFPEWIGDSEIVTVTVSDLGKQLECVNLQNKSWTVLLPYTRMDISEPLNYQKYILFRGSFKGIENIYALSKDRDRQVYQVTFSPFGAYHPSVSRDSALLLFSDYTVNGFRIAQITLEPSTWIKITKDTTLYSENKEEDLPDRGDTPEIYPVNPYHKSNHLFNFHSWLPLYVDLDDFTGNLNSLPIDLGVMAFSQNLLSTAISSIGYRYRDGTHEFLPRFIWRGWYPVFELSGRFNGPEDEFGLKSYVPLVFNRGKYISGLRPQVEYEYAGIDYMEGEERKTGIHYLHFKFALSHYLRLSQRDLYPRMGQYLLGGITQTPGDHAVFGSLWYMQTGIFLPGMALHHHLYIQAGLQRQQAGNYYLPVNHIAFPRGFASHVSQQMNCLFVNYAFPLVYPDFSIGPLMYLKRIKINLFHDWSYGKDIREIHGSEVSPFTGNYRSLGTEIEADLHLIRIIFPVTAGVRLGYLPGREKFFAELMFSMNTGVF